MMGDEPSQMIRVEPCRKDEIEKIVNGLNAYNLEEVPSLNELWTPLEFVAKKPDGSLAGGILGGLGYWNGLEIKILWVEEESRGKGIGGALLNHMEDVATAKGATISMLDTFDFQAEGFYLKNGYEVMGEINDFPAGHKRIYLSKRLAS